MAGWTTGLFDCFDDCGICLYGYCCTPCLYGENAQKIDGSSCCGSCCIWMLLTECGLCCLVHMGKRQALRQRYGLQEDCNDCVATTFCAACAICQEARELKYRSNVPGVQAPVIMQQPGANMYPTVAQPGAMKPGQY